MVDQIEPRAKLAGWMWGAIGVLATLIVVGWTARGMLDQKASTSSLEQHEAEEKRESGAHAAVHADETAHVTSMELRIKAVETRLDDIRDDLKDIRQDLKEIGRAVGARMSPERPAPGGTP